MTERPNFLFIVTDQQRADHLGCYGNPILRTPNIDGLAGSGSRFDRFYVASPSCQPNRASIMTGRMPSLNGVRNNGLPLPLEATTFVEILRAAGYRTALLGKSHLQNMTGNPPVQERNIEEGLEQPAAQLLEAEIGGRRADEYELENEQNWPAPAMERRSEPYYGFEHFEICTNHGDEVAGDYLYWARERDPDFDRLRDPENALDRGNYSAPQARRTAIPEELYPSAYAADRTIAFLEGHKNENPDQPFYIQMGIPDPHYPFTPPGRYWGLYDPEDMELPANFEASPTPLQAGLKKRLAEGKAFREGHATFAVTEREAREIIALTYGMIAMIDDCVGRVMEALRRLDYDQDTIVIFTSDHGDHMGDHGIMLKSPMHFQGLTRVPFIWRDLRDGRGTDQTLASSIDLAPTILRRAGIQPNNGVQGRDLLNQDLAPDSLLIETDHPFPGGPPNPRTRTLMTKDWRMSVHQGFEWGELYDLTNDPGETTNLWTDDQHGGVRAELTERLLRRMMEMQENSPLQTGLS